MSKILLIGKELPDALDFVKALSDGGNTVFAAADDMNQESDAFGQNIFTSTWNKSSAISAHSFLIKAETKLDSLENVVFYFDSDFFSTIFQNSSDIQNAVDSMISPYLFLAGELIKRIDQKKEKITVAFIVKNQNEKSAELVGVAQAAFCQLAQNFAANVENRDFLRVLLARNSSATENCTTEAQLGQWTAEALKITAEIKKQSSKQAAAWNKAGGKISSGFNLFKF